MGRREFFSLLDSDLYLDLSNSPARIHVLIAKSSHLIIVIDEIQRLPELLNEVHLILQGGIKVSFEFMGQKMAFSIQVKDSDNMISMGVFSGLVPTQLL